MNFQKKCAILCILKILEEKTDDSHYMNYTDIMVELKRDYGIELERKAVARAIESLIDFEYDIDRDGKRGVALLNRTLQPSEISYLVDAIYSSRIISAEDSKRLSESISSLLSVYERKKYKTIYKTEDPKRTINKEFFNNIDLINTAIDMNSKISFNYLSYDKSGNETLRRDGYEYKASPYYLINNFGKYYLLSNTNGSKTTTHYRVDYMKNVKILDEERFPMRNIKELGYDFDINEYIKNHIYMFGGETIDAEIRINKPERIMDVIDWFGKNAVISNRDGVVKAYVKCNEAALIYWALQYSDAFTVLSPSTTRNKIYISLKKSYLEYKELQKDDSSMPDIRKIIRNVFEETKDENDFKYTKKNILTRIKNEIENGSLDMVKVSYNDNKVTVTNGKIKTNINVITFSKNLQDIDYFSLLEEMERKSESDILVILSKGRLIDNNKKTELSSLFLKKNTIKENASFNFKGKDITLTKDLTPKFTGFKRENGNFYKYLIY